MRNCSVIVVVFDLPSTNSVYQKAYRKFRAYLLKNGYVFFQESIYIKLLNRSSNERVEISALKAEAPKDGEVVAIPMGLKTFKNIVYIRGGKFNMSTFCDTVFVI